MSDNSQFVRRRKMFAAKAAALEFPSLTGPVLDTTWRLWAKREEINRSVPVRMADSSSYFCVEFVPRSGYMTLNCAH